MLINKSGTGHGGGFVGPAVQDQLNEEQQIISQRPLKSGYLFTEASFILNILLRFSWYTVQTRKKATLTNKVFSLLSEKFFPLFTSFPLSGIHNVPTEVERQSYLSHFKLKVQCCFHLGKYLYKPFTRPLQATVCQDPSNFHFIATKSSWHQNWKSSTIICECQFEYISLLVYGDE